MGDTHADLMSVGMHRSHRKREAIMTAIVWLAAAVVTGILAWIVLDIIIHGVSHVSLSFLTGDVEEAGRKGGIGPILVSTFLLLTVTLVTAVPLSLATAVALTEKSGNDSWFSLNVRRSLDVLAGVPSIVFGLFGNAFFAITLGMGYSILAGGLTLACMVLPILIRTSEQAIIAVPDEYRHAATALGLGRFATLWRVVLPIAAPALIAGIVLSTGRALAETAALLFTSGYVSRTPESLLDSGRVLSVHIYDLAMHVPGGGSQAYATACVLIAILLIINMVTSALLRFAGLSQQTAQGAGL